MQKLNIDLGSCVKVYSKNSNCTSCADICPISSISFNQNIPIVDESCIDCGGCIGICPSEAISLDDFKTMDFIFDFIQSSENLISCKKNIPCLALLSVENLISTAILKGDTIVDIGHCETCNIKDPLYNQIKQNIEEANTLLEKLKHNSKIDMQNIAYTKEKEIEKEQPDRRAFFKNLTIKGAIKNKIEFEKEVQKSENRNILNSNDTSKMKQKQIPNKRKLLYMALKRLDKIDDFELLEEESLSFTSQKSIDSSCDNCSFCYRICPTGALSTNRRGNTIEFDTLLCLKCRLCHDVCQSDSIHLEPVSTQSFFQSKVEELIQFSMIRCEDCQAYFTQLKDEKMCRRCTIEEEEAKSLWGIQ